MRVLVSGNLGSTDHIIRANWKMGFWVNWRVLLLGSSSPLAITDWPDLIIYTIIFFFFFFLTWVWTKIGKTFLACHIRLISKRINIKLDLSMEVVSIRLKMAKGNYLELHKCFAKDTRYLSVELFHWGQRIADEAQVAAPICNLRS